MDKQFMTTSEVAQYLSVSQAGIRKWQRQGRIPFYKLNGAIRFSIEEINKWTSKNKRNIYYG